MVSIGLKALVGYMVQIINMVINRKYFILGLVVFYLIQFLSPNKIVYFSSYGVAIFFFYLSTKNLSYSIFCSLVLSIFSDVGLAGSWFLMQPKELDLGSGWMITPMTVLLLSLLPFSISRKISNFCQTDIVIFIIFILSVLSFLFFPYTNSFLGLISLVEIIILYYILRQYTTKDNLKEISVLVISMLIFQTVLGLLQLVLRHPVGILAESASLNSNPFGITAAENQNLFRLTGTFGHPNLFASFLLVTLPFLFLKINKNRKLLFLTFLSSIVLVFTYSRAAWIFLVIVSLLMTYKRIMQFLLDKHVIKRLFTGFAVICISIFLLSPYISERIDTFSEAFSPGGSMDTRFMLWREGVNIIAQYPLTGVGLNRSLQTYATNPTTDIFDTKTPSGFSRIHNMFLEIGSEEGFPAMILFIVFLYLVIRQYFASKRDYPKNTAFYGLLGLIGMSMLNPFFHSSQFRLYFLLSAIILV
ncbi:MAG: O-antigen ligase family protein [Patescibacteria group bacterium]|nr:O-antigen ligase family protein [Patescibacteria group bacterium]